jgi:carboxymethylenebutenolidase
MTPDGTADGYFVQPASGTAPGVLVWPDIFGLRPAFRQMGTPLAEAGYSVLVVNPFYRVKKPTHGGRRDHPNPAATAARAGLNETTHTTYTPLLATAARPSASSTTPCPETVTTGVSDKHA